jgi:hypothetical protein
MMRFYRLDFLCNVGMRDKIPFLAVVYAHCPIESICIKPSTNDSRFLGRRASRNKDGSQKDREY